MAIKITCFVMGVFICFFAFYMGVKPSACTCPGYSVWRTQLFIPNITTQLSSIDVQSCSAFGCAPQTNFIFPDLYVLGTMLILFGVFKRTTV